jgi:hypothetical protein
MRPISIKRSAKHPITMLNAERKVVEQARAFIRDSRLGCAICRQLLEHVEHWPSWSKLKEFEYVNGAGVPPDRPFRYIDGSYATDNETKKTNISCNVALQLIDEGVFPWGEMQMLAAKVKLVVEDKTALGLGAIRFRSTILLILFASLIAPRGAKEAH